MFKLERVKAGDTRAIYAICSRSDRCELLDFLKSPKVAKCELAKLWHLLEELVNWPVGRHLPETDFRNEGEGFYAIKSHQLRIICFMVERDLYCTHAYIKKSDKMPKTQLKRAIRIRREYLDAKHE